MVGKQLFFLTVLNSTNQSCADHGVLILIPKYKTTLSLYCNWQGYRELWKCHKTSALDGWSS